MHTEPKKSDSMRLERLDVMRGLACLLVLIYHCRADNLPWLGDWRYYGLIAWSQYPFLPFSELGFTGVPLFFVLSGFCLHLATLKRGNSLQLVPFMMRRFWRIFPAYSVLICSIAAGAWLFALCPLNLGMFTPISLKDTLYIMATHLSITQNLWPMIDRDSLWGRSGHLWTVAVEWQFYLAYPLLFLLNRLLGGQTMILPFLASLVVNLTLFYLKAPMDGFIFPGFSMTFYAINNWLLGACLADAHYRGKPLFSRVGGWVLLSGSAMFISYQYRPLVGEVFFFAAVFYASLLECYLNRKIGLGIMERWICDVGIISYSVYLWHVFVEQAIRGALFILGLNIDSAFVIYGILLPTALWGSLVIARFSYTYIERPFLRR